jgi:hypothetical protein
VSQTFTNLYPRDSGPYYLGSFNSNNIIFRNLKSSKEHQRKKFVKENIES